MVRKISCKNCGKVLMEADIKVGILIKDCPKCGKKNIYEFSARSKRQPEAKPPDDIVKGN